MRSLLGTIGLVSTVGGKPEVHFCHQLIPGHITECFEALPYSRNGNQMHAAETRKMAVRNSLQTLFFVTFVGACVSRWLAEFGIGLIIAFGWSAVAGGSIGILSGTVKAVVCWTIDSVNHRLRITSDILASLCATIVAGMIGGFWGGAIGFAASTIGDIDHVSVRGLWFEAQFRDGTRDGQVFAAFVLIPAMYGGLAASLSSIFDSLQYAFVRFLAVAIAMPVFACFTGTMLTLLAADVSAILLEKFPLGVLSIALWLTGCAIIATVVGQIVAIFWEWSRHARNYSLSNALFWCAAVVFVLLVTEAAVRGWVHFAFQSVIAMTSEI